MLINVCWQYLGIDNNGKYERKKDSLNIAATMTGSFEVLGEQELPGPIQLQKCAATNARVRLC